MTRYISFQGIINSRDLGGIINAEGKEVRRGLLLRTANLSQATDADLVKLEENYHLSLVIDLRTATERNGKPDRLPSDVRYMTNPIFSETTAGITRENQTSTAFMLPDMVQLYRTMIIAPTCQSALHEVLMAIFSHDYDQGAVLWHCTAGKDRCGIVSALVLAALGAGRSEIMKDYAINADVFIAQADVLYRKVLRSGRPETVAATARDVFLAIPRYMESALGAIDERYENSIAYLTNGLGIPQKDITAFQRRLLQ